MKSKLLLKIRNTLIIPFTRDKSIDGCAIARQSRRRVHETFGLTDDEWTALRDYLTNYEAMGVAVQRGEWLTKECSRLERTLGDSTKAMAEISREYREISNEKATAIGREMRHSRGILGWHLSPELSLRCVEAGGCCGRSCQCCRKYQTTSSLEWAGHCTPACGCCMEHHGTDKLIGPLQDPIELGYNIRPSKEDIFSRKMMDALIWKPCASQIVVF
ncbi:uncharacterized protein APUU_20759A [Aspergillus puulaauensis]|uniref:Uncharacterized protein n=1 Tax=Aspergillus puulaauensis TaxID=1220207 RepID=A0A7R7XFF0_9EURO|nr:uncharacterized protein APUU_20759A [Aspergillus puulaauensis]BCS20327.1 hypothetical protein APUU_20759A [Aspergillus puulaauensis]